MTLKVGLARLTAVSAVVAAMLAVMPMQAMAAQPYRDPV
jgi:hypothetical protein